MRHRVKHIFVSILMVICGATVHAQILPPPATQFPVFESRADSLEYVVLDAKLVKRAEQALNVKVLDSVQTARRTFLETHRFVWRTNYRQDRSFTPYQSLKTIANKDSITRISIVGRGRKRLPDSLYLYKNLAELELIDFRLSRLPKRLVRQSQFKKISLYNNFPEKRLRLPRSSAVTSLNIRGDEKGKLPKSYKSFRNLEILNLTRNNMKEFPNTAGCDNLKYLSLVGNAIDMSKRPAKFSVSITKLDLSLNGITRVPSWIGDFRKLQSLNLNNNRVEKIEPGIERIGGLQELSLYKNNLGEIPPMLYTMKSLKVIDLYYNRIPRVDREIGNLKDLEILYLANNEIYSLPEEIGQLTKLRELYLHHNKLSNLPASVGDLKDLGILRINNNNIVEWPAGLIKLKMLSNFDASFNQFESIPVNELDFRQMKILSLGGNPWTPDMRKTLKLWADALRENNIVVHLGDGKTP